MSLYQVSMKPWFFTSCPSRFMNRGHRPPECFILAWAFGMFCAFITEVGWNPLVSMLVMTNMLLTCSLTLPTTFWKALVKCIPLIFFITILQLAILLSTHKSRQAWVWRGGHIWSTNRWNGRCRNGWHSWGVQNQFQKVREVEYMYHKLNLLQS